MVSVHGPDPDRSRTGWQGDGIDVEVEKVRWKRGFRYRWSLYHHARLIRTGMTRAAWSAELASQFHQWWYRARR